MNPLLQSLLGQQTSPEFSQTEITGVGINPNANPQGQIDVIGRRNRPTDEEGKYDDYVLNNTEAVRNRQDDLKQTEEASTRKGMFGVKGTLRDILGLVGDAFLVQGGGKAIYAQQRERERIADAGAGFTEDPVAAAERVGYYDLGSGLEMFDKYKANQLKTAQQEDLAANRASQIDTRQANLIADGRKVAQAVLAQSGAYDENGNISPAALSVLDRIAAQSNATREDLIGENMTGEEARLYGGAGVNPYQQAQLPLAERRVATGERNAATAEGRLRVSQQQADTAARALGLREGSEQWNQYMDMLDVATDAQKKDDKKPSVKRSVPGASRFRPASN